MKTMPTRLFAAFITGVLMLTASVFGYTADDDIPEVTDRVARISDLKGDVRIKRFETEEWETAVLNLPIVEGDEIASDTGARFELQFGSHKFVRVAEQSYLRVVTLKDEGIALSLSTGMMSVRLLEFSTGSSFFEIDLPGSTVAVQAAGRYRVDAGGIDFDGVGISVSEGGLARVYSSTSGFTLQDGRSAKVFNDGRRSGEWEFSDFAGLNDEFDSWTLERERIVDQRLFNARYDEYYDREIYGADELDSYGNWVHTADYGYIWRPSRASIRQYSDWSPYRYGHWRWIPAFGWTWVNDEPWGWATYHYGRWIWYNGGWYWSPYGYYRTGRSWWRPAIVYLTVYNNYVCWYPLPYYYPYYNYNRHYLRQKDPRRQANTARRQPNPVPTLPSGPGMTAEERRARYNERRGVPPPGSVVIADKVDFGRDTRTIRRAPVEIGTEIARKDPFENRTPPILPERREINDRMSKNIAAERPAIAAKADSRGRVGAAPRNTNAPLDGQLRNTRMLGGRTPLETVPQTTEPVQPRTETQVTPTNRRTGAFERPAPAPRQQPAERRPVKTPPIVEVPPRADPSAPAPVENKAEPVPRSRPAPRTQPAPRSEPAPRTQPVPEKKDDSPADRRQPEASQPRRPSSTPIFVQPTRQEPTRPAPPANRPPVRQEVQRPAQQPAPRRETPRPAAPAQRPQPKQESPSRGEPRRPERSETSQ